MEGLLLLLLMLLLLMLLLLLLMLILARDISKHRAGWLAPCLLASLLTN